MTGIFMGWKQDRARTGAAAVLCVSLLLLAPNASAQIEVEGGGAGNSLWLIDNTGGTSNGQPIDGTCDGSPGMTVVDAVLDPDNTTEVGIQPDSYDNGQTVFIDDVQFAPSAFEESDRSILAGPEMMSGLDVRVEYGVATTTATMRTLIALTNPSADEISVTVDHVTNVGSNNQTQVELTSSGDNLFDTDDRWIITRDMNVIPVRPVITHVHRGVFDDENNAPKATFVSQVAFNCADIQGVRVTYDVPVPAGETVFLLFFNQLNQTPGQAVQLAHDNFDSNPPLGGDLLFGLLPEVLLRVVNWEFRPDECRSANKLKLSLESDGGRLRYKWAKGDATLTSDFGEPTAETPYRLCIIDTLDGVPEIEECYDVHGGFGWKAKGNGFKYRDKEGLQDGVTNLRLRRGEQGRAKITAKGEGVNLPTLPLAQDPEIVVMIANDREQCWVGRFEEEPKTNDAEGLNVKQRNKPVAEEE